DPSLLVRAATLAGAGPGETSAPMLLHVPECTSKQRVPSTFVPCGQVTVAFTLAEQNVELRVLRHNAAVSVTVVPTRQPGDMHPVGVICVVWKSLCAYAGISEEPAPKKTERSPSIAIENLLLR